MDTNKASFWRRWTIAGWQWYSWRKGLGCLPANCNVILRGDKSFVYDLDVQRGIVSSRVALLLRSAEIKPLLSDLFYFFLSILLAGASGCLERYTVKQVKGNSGNTLLVLLLLHFLFFPQRQEPGNEFIRQYGWASLLSRLSFFSY